jgi:hypothetical protein
MYVNPRTGSDPWTDPYRGTFGGVEPSPFAGRRDPDEMIVLQGLGLGEEPATEARVTLRADITNEEWLTWTTGILGYALTENWQGLVGHVASILESETGAEGIAHLMSRHTAAEFVQVVTANLGGSTLIGTIAGALAGLIEPYWAQMQSYVASWLDPNGGNPDPNGNDPGGNDPPPQELDPIEEARQACLASGGTFSDAGGLLSCTGGYVPQVPGRIVAFNKPELVSAVSQSTALQQQMAAYMQARDACGAAGGAWDAKTMICTPKTADKSGPVAAAPWYKNKILWGAAAVVTVGVGVAVARRRR